VHPRHRRWSPIVDANQAFSVTRAVSRTNHSCCKEGADIASTLSSKLHRTVLVARNTRSPSCIRTQTKVKRHDLCLEGVLWVRTMAVPVRNLGDQTWARFG
jgi:hypothetical protein